MKMMSDIENAFVKAKPCFGQHEDGNNSWHCKGCPIGDECERNKNEKIDEVTSNG